MRILFFVVAFAVALLWTAPLDDWLLEEAREQAAPFGVGIDADAVRPALPAGLRAEGLVVASGQAALRIDSIYVGVGRGLDATACGGEVHGTVSPAGLDLSFDGIDLSRCVESRQLLFAGALQGSLRAADVDWADAGGGRAATGRLEVRSDGGLLGGILPGAGARGGDLPIGEWEYSDLELAATLEAGEIVVEEGRARTRGVQWEVVSGRLPAPGTDGRLRIDLRARAADGGAGGLALLSLLPRAGQDRDGWRRYRVTGTLQAPRLLGIE